MATPFFLYSYLCILIVLDFLIPQNLGVIMNCKQMSTKETTPKLRDERIDSVKYWLIVLVITGHVFEIFKIIPECEVLWNWIYMFHMPLFIFISGYFSRKKDRKSLRASIWKLLEPLIIFQTLSTFIRFISKGSVSLSSILTPWWVLWYLLSLIYWRLMIQVIPDRLLKRTKLILFSTFCISILAGFFPFNRLLSIQRTLSFMPFFFLGYYMKGKNIYLPDKYKLFSFLFLVLMIVMPLYFPQYLGDLCQAAPYGSIFGALKRILIFLLAIPMSIAFINVCPNMSWAARQGRLTMQYYIYHALAILVLMAIVSKLNIPMSFISATIYTLGITAGIGIASRFPYFTKFTNPSSFKLRDGSR